MKTFGGNPDINKINKNEADAVKESEELSDDDHQLQETLAALVTQLKKDTKLNAKIALESIRKLIRASTTSMTAAPKPLKYMRPYFNTMRDVFHNLSTEENRSLCADIISVLSIAMGNEKYCLEYRLLCHSDQPIGYWGHEYVHHLAGQICTSWPETTGSLRCQLLYLVKQIVYYDMEHNSEIEACDLLMEIDRLDLLKDFVNENNFSRVCLYLQSCLAYSTEKEYSKILELLIKCSCKFNQHTRAIGLACMQPGPKMHAEIEKIFLNCDDLIVRRQLAFILARQHVPIELPSTAEEFDPSELIEILSNTYTNQFFLDFARELDILEPKTPEEVYMSKSSMAGATSVTSSKNNLAASFVNAFANAGFGVDKLLTQEDANWVYRNKEFGMLSATASLGLIMLWDVDKGLAFIDKYFYAADNFIVGGALLGCGIANCGILSEADPAHALLSDYVSDENLPKRIGAILGLGIAYAGTNNTRVIETLKAIFEPADDVSASEITGLTALSLGLIAVSSCNSLVSQILMKAILSYTDKEMPDDIAHFLLLGLGMVYLGCRNAADTVISTLKKKLMEPFKSMSTIMLEMCAYAGTGNVLKVQHFLHICSEHYSDPSANEKDLSTVQSIATLGIALIAMGEDIGCEMAYRSLGNLMRYCEPCIRRSVPLAMGLLSVSNPKPRILDALSKYSHDNDMEVASNAMFAMGLVGAGSNSARLAATLRQLALYHAKDSNSLFTIRIAQGLANLGKGTLTLSPFHADRKIMDPVAVASLLAVSVVFLNGKDAFLGSSHYLLYVLVPAIQPRMLITLDESLKQVHVPVRVGTPVDVVGQAGTPNTITGFQTHTTPVLLSTNERAELATDEYLALNEVMEGFVILRKNPNFME